MGVTYGCGKVSLVVLKTIQSKLNSVANLVSRTATVYTVIAVIYDRKIFIKWTPVSHLRFAKVITT